MTFSIQVIDGIGMISYKGNNILRYEGITPDNLAKFQSLINELNEKNTEPSEAIHTIVHMSPE